MSSLFSGAFTTSWIDAAQSFLWDPLQNWLASHPVIEWLVYHPLWTLSLAVVVLLLFAGLWSAIARLTESFWLSLVRLPFRLIAWLFSGLVWLIIKLRSGGQASKLQAQEKPEPTTAERLEEITARLTQLQAEQDSLLQEMQDLVGQLPSTTEQSSTAKAARKIFPAKPQAAPMQRLEQG